MSISPASIIQKVLACEAQHLSMLGAAVVPQIHLTARDSESKETFVVMQALETTLEDFVHVNKYKWDRLRHGLEVMLRCVAAALKHLQEKYLFEHRDLHCRNIMFKGEAVFMIDFGRARLSQPTDRTGEWEKSGAPGAELRRGRDPYLCCSLFSSRISMHRFSLHFCTSSRPPRLCGPDAAFPLSNDDRWRTCERQRGAGTVDADYGLYPDGHPQPVRIAVPIPRQLWYPEALLRALPS